MSLASEYTHFSRDTLGRWICNLLLEEAIASASVKPFDIIVVGGGSFGAVFAQHMFERDRAAKAHRILVLEAGPFDLPEHVQNMALLGLGPPDPSRIADLRAIGQDRIPRNEVWGLPWHSSTKFPGLAYSVGGRSAYFGGWSPRLLDAEMPAAPDARHSYPWPQTVVDDLKQRYFDEAAAQIGTDATNDFINGELHKALRRQLRDGIAGGAVPEAVAFAQLDLHVQVPVGTPPNDINLWKLEAPLAVQAVSTRSGFFPFNKFSSIPLLIRAARLAQMESNGVDSNKRLMIVPNCHVTRLIESAGRVVTVRTAQGDVSVPPGGLVVICAATIENARLARLSFGTLPNAGLPGQNLMTHLRSNITIRIPRAALSSLPAAAKELEASALFVKGRHPNAGPPAGHFHLQITAAGLGPLDQNSDSEAELFKKVPDIDGFAPFKNVTDDHIIITLRGIGETHPQNSDSFVRLDPEPDEYAVSRAFVAVADPNDPAQRASNPNTAADADLWDAMDRAADDVALVFAGGQPYKVLEPGTANTWHDVPAGQRGITVVAFIKRRDGMGTTHHEAGTLWLGEDPTQSVTNPNCHFHHLENVFALGPALLPSVGSPNPMLTGVALARRLVDHLLQPAPLYVPEPGFVPLFDGATVSNWQMAGQGDVGSFIRVDDVIEPIPGGELGLYWNTTPMPSNFVLRLEWLRTRNDDNSGVFVRFPDPNSRPDYFNKHYVAVDFGFEVQIDELGQPDGLGIHKTGAIYDQPGQTLSQIAAKPPGQWNEFEIKVLNQQYTVNLNGTQVSKFTFVPGSDAAHPDRGLTNTPRFVGLQAHTGRVQFRHIRFKAI
jgi:choline dehydrogenase-like flavoprotein